MFSLEHSQAHHAAPASFDAISPPEFASSLYSSRRASVEAEPFERHVGRHGARTSFDANASLQGMPGGGVSNIAGNDGQVFTTSSVSARSTASFATGEVGPVGQTPHHHEPSRSFDANANLQPEWYQLPLQTGDRQQETTMTLAAMEQSPPSLLLQQEQQRHQQPSRMMHNNGGIDRLGECSGGTSMDRSFHTLERRHPCPSEEMGRPFSADKKRKRLPYRCK